MTFQLKKNPPKKILKRADTVIPKGDNKNIMEFIQIPSIEKDDQFLFLENNDSFLLNNKVIKEKQKIKKIPFQEKELEFYYSFNKIMIYPLSE